ncbi:unnamed protein product [Urochloa humidicola]
MLRGLRGGCMRTCCMTPQSNLPLPSCNTWRSRCLLPIYSRCRSARSTSHSKWSDLSCKTYGLRAHWTHWLRDQQDTLDISTERSTGPCRIVNQDFIYIIKQEQVLRFRKPTRKNYKLLIYTLMDSKDLSYMS